MNQPEKCVLVIEESLPLGIVANTAAILGITLGKERPELVGKTVIDQNGGQHLGIVTIPVPILGGTGEQIKQIRDRLGKSEFQGVTVVDFSQLAQNCKTYEQFTEEMSRVPAQQLHYYGLALCGSKKQINRLTGNLPLLKEKPLLP